MPFSRRQNQMGKLWVCLCVQLGHVCLIYFLLMTAWFFCRATISDCVKVQSILNLYEQASRQNINRGKTNIFFSSNTSTQSKQAIQVFLGVPAIQTYEQYIGLPSLVGRH